MSQPRRTPMIAFAGIVFALLCIAAPAAAARMHFSVPGCQQLCTFSPGEAVSFATTYDGKAADLYRYDWDGDGRWDAKSVVPIHHHTYRIPGVYQPRVAILQDGVETTSALARPILIGKVAPLKIAPIPFFQWSPVVVETGVAVRFENLTIGSASSFQWTFEDATPASSTAAEPTVRFNSAGVKRVTLEACNSDGCRDIRLPVPVEDDGGNPLGLLLVTRFVVPGCDLICEVDEGTLVRFDQEFLGNPDSYHYDWDGDGTFDQSSSRPVLSHRFNDPGVFLPRLEIRRGSESFMVPLFHVLVVGGLVLPDEPPIPVFEWTPVIAPPGTAVTFINLTLGADTYRWTFEDGTPATSTAENPVVTFNSEGLKEANLEACNVYGCRDLGLPVPVFDEGTDLPIDLLAITRFAAPDCTLLCELEIGATVTFEVETVGDPDFYDYDWDGDGTYEQTSTRPINQHTFSEEGVVLPKLRIRKGGEDFRRPLSSLLVFGDLIPEREPIAFFHWEPFTAEPGETVRFVNDTLGNVTRYRWTFEDGTPPTSGAEDPMVTFATEGLKDVTLEACNNLGCDTVTVPVPIVDDDGIDLPIDNACADDPSAACLVDGRYRVRVQWETDDNRQGPGSLTEFGSENSAVFWFFDETNWELMVKVLDGCGANGHNWVLAAGVTNLAFELEITDTVTGAVRRYTNPAGITPDATIDTAAFPCTATPAAPPQAAAAQLMTTQLTQHAPEVSAAPAPVSRPAPKAAVRCGPEGDSLCLRSGRFEIDIAWRTAEGDTGKGSVVPFGSDLSGLFWFFDEANWELMVKVLDGCAFNNRYWVFTAATTNVEYTLTVRDKLTGETKTYTNPLDSSAPAITDTDAFASCN